MSQPSLLLLFDLPPGVPYEPESLSTLGKWRNGPGTESANLASLSTGAIVEQHGVIAEWECRPDGVLPRRAPRSRLMVPPLWERQPNSLSVAWPWTSGSNVSAEAGQPTIVGPDFMRIVASDACTPLPNQTSPRTLAKSIEALRHLPDAMDVMLLRQAGYGESVAECTMLAEALSAHAIATALLTQRNFSFAAVRLRLTLTPQVPSRLTEFIALLHQRYYDICPDWQHFCVIRTRPINANASQDSVWGNTSDGTRFYDSTSFARSLAKTLGLSLPYDDNELLPESHWQTVQGRYQVPKLLRSDVAPVIAKITGEVQTAIKVLQLRRLAITNT